MDKMPKSKKKVALVLREVSDHLRGNLYGILAYVQKNTAWDVHTEGALPRLSWDRVSDWEGDGLIAAIDTHDELHRIIEKDVVAVNVSSRIPDLLIPTVVADNEAIGALAANHLLEKGLKNFAFAGPMDLDHNIRRLAGFSQTLEKAGFSPKVLDVRYIHRLFEYDKHSVVDTHDLGRQITSLPHPVGILAPHDDFGCWILKTCRNCGIKVPTQVAVIGVDNFELLCGFTTPPLSSVA